MTAIRINNINYTKTDAGYCYKNENGKQVRIKAAEFDAAYNEWTALEAAEAKAKAEAAKAADDKKAEDAVNKKANKPAKKRRPKDIAYEATKTFANEDFNITLTAKQVAFIKRIPDTCFYENGLESTMWVDVLVDEIGGEFAGKPMTVGAMISTIREKKLVYVALDKVNGKKAKYFGFTEIGKQVAADLGLN